MSPILLLDYLGVGFFAASGALVASRKQLDIVGFMFLAMLTGTGGGTLRDLILDVPIFWVKQPAYIVVCTAAAIVTYFTAHLIEYRYRMALWVDAIGLAAYAVFGAYKGLEVTGSPVIAAVTGTMTAAVGGILRDVVTGEPSVLMRKEIYMVAGLAGACVYVIANQTEIPAFWAMAAGFATALGARSGALMFGWSLPTYRSRPGRDADQSLAEAREKHRK